MVPVLYLHLYDLVEQVFDLLWGQVTHNVK